MEIDLEPLHLPDVLEAVLHPQEPGTQRGNVQRYLFSSMRAELARPAAEAADQAEDGGGGRATPSGNFDKSTEFPEINLA